MRVPVGDVLTRAWEPFGRLFAVGGSLYWLHLASAAAIAFTVYWLTRYGKTGVSPRNFVSFCFPKSIYAHPSARLDFRYFVVNTVLYGVLVAPLLLTSATIARGTVALLVSLFGVPDAVLPAGAASRLGVTLAAVVASDLGFFASHYLQHRVGALWEFHKVHHAAEVLNPITGYRQHPVDQALDFTLGGAATGVVLGVSAYAFDPSLDVVTILGVNAAVFLFNFAGIHLRHSHVRLSYGPVLDRILISPVLHQFHHSRTPQTFGQNLGGMLAIWDRLAGTLYVPPEGEQLDVGLPEGEAGAYDSVANLYLLPFVRAGRRFLPLAGRPIKS